jgi:hypothetical protein
VSGHQRWETIHHRASETAAGRERIAQARARQEREYRRLHWRVVRLYDHLRAASFGGSK